MSLAFKATRALAHAATSGAVASSATKRIGMAVVGAGRIGKIHAETLSKDPKVHLAAICSGREATAKQLAEHLRVPQHTARYEDIMENKDVDAVVLCSPTDQHAEQIVAAAKAGKHVFCEKPVALDLGVVDRTLKVVEDSGITFMIGFNRRFDANFSRVQQAVAMGEIGETRMVHIVSRDPSPPSAEYARSSGGMFLDMSIHDFDMARFVVGGDAEVEEVYTKASCVVNPEIGAAGDYDTAVTMLTFSNGVVATVDNCREAVYGYDQRIEVFGSAGSVSSENIFPNACTFRGRTTIYQDLPLNFFMERYLTSYKVELNEFVRACMGGAVTATAADARASLVIALAARESARQKRPVKTSEIVA